MEAYRLHGEQGPEQDSGDEESLKNRGPRGQNRTPLSRLHEGRFGRMFRKLEPAPDYSIDELRPLAETMLDQSPEPAGGWGSSTQPEADNPAIPSAYTYLGQFIDHDVTFDPVSSLQGKHDPDALVDFRSPRFDLDSLYGSGPEDEPFQYDKSTNRQKFLVESNQNGVEDLPRNSQGTALIGDPRNDENIIVSQLQLIFLKLHNKFVDQLSSDGATPAERIFSEAQRLTRWHYQWVVVRDYLPRICGPYLGDRLVLPEAITGESPRAEAAIEAEFSLRWYAPKKSAYLPVEFSVAAFRFGHSQIRPAYDLNDQGASNIPIFLPGEVGELDDLRGNRPLPQPWTIAWNRFLEIDGSIPQPSRLIDTHLSAGLFNLPGSELPLALRNLLRGQALSLPSGQDVAAAIGLAPKTGVELGGVLDPTPLWFYILKESELEGGAHLGAVGATIVAEVLLGLLQLDPSSFVNLEPRWRPTIPVAGAESQLADLVRFATT